MGQTWSGRCSALLINVRYLDDVDVAALALIPFDGKNL